MKAICLPRRKRSSFWAFCSSEADLLFELGILDDLVQSRGNLRGPSISKFGKSFPYTDREDFRPSKESTISTSLIHNTASDGKIRTTWDLCFESCFPHQKWWGLRNLSICSSDSCGLCCPTTYFCGISTGCLELVVNGLGANMGIGIAP